MSGDRPLRIAGVADRLGVSVPWLQRHIARLRRDHRFPGPLPGFFPHRYDPLAIDEWRAYWRAQQPAAAAAPPAKEAAGADADGTDWSEILRARAQGFARQAGRA